MILRYVADAMIELGYSWEDEIGSEVTVQSELHADPLARDEAAKSFVEASME